MLPQKNDNLKFYFWIESEARTSIWRSKVSVFSYWLHIPVHVGKKPSYLEFQPLVFCLRRGKEQGTQEAGQCLQLVVILGIALQFQENLIHRGNHNHDSKHYAFSRLQRNVRISHSPNKGFMWTEMSSCISIPITLPRERKDWNINLILLPNLNCSLWFCLSVWLSAGSPGIMNFLT